MGMTISGLARSAGVNVETVRYYQRRGLIETPPRGADPFFCHEAIVIAKEAQHEPRPESA